MFSMSKFVKFIMKYELRIQNCATGVVLNRSDFCFVLSQIFNESISSIQGGCVGNDGCTEVVVCTYTGRIFGLSTQCARIHISDNAQMRSPFSTETNNRIVKFK